MEMSESVRDLDFGVKSNIGICVTNTIVALSYKRQSRRHPHENGEPVKREIPFLFPVRRGQCWIPKRQSYLRMTNLLPELWNIYSDDIKKTIVVIDDTSKPCSLSSIKQSRYKISQPPFCILHNSFRF